MATKSWQNRSGEKTNLWSAHIEAWRQSGVSQAEYCRKNGINNHQFGYWKKKFTNKEKDYTVTKICSITQNNEIL